LASSLPGAIRKHGRCRKVRKVVTSRGSDTGIKRQIVAADDRTFTALMEQLQEGYVASVAATAGCILEPIPRDLYGFDVRFVRPGRAGEEEVTLNAQLKNTTTVKPDPARAHFSHQLRKRDYLERLAAPRRDVKAILVVMATSPTQASWTSAAHESMAIRHCCYWAYLENHVVEPDVTSPTVHIPTGNIFDAPALASMMAKLSKGEPLR
jgi:hypothetical protein